jgi:hypothetical protein
MENNVQPTVQQANSKLSVACSVANSITVQSEAEVNFLYQITLQGIVEQQLLTYSITKLYMHANHITSQCRATAHILLKYRMYCVRCCNSSP